LLLVAAVAAAVARFLRTRLVQPIQAIDTAMQAVSQGNYQARVATDSADELGRLSKAINSAISTIEANVQEIERRRDEAMHALNDADSMTLARDGLVQALVKELGAPLVTLHQQLAAIALHNESTPLRQSIRESMQRLQESQLALRELIDIATSPHTKPTPAQHLASMAQTVLHIERSILAVAEREHFQVQFVAPANASHVNQVNRTDNLMVALDVDRVTKALVRLTTALAKRSTREGVYIHLQLARRATDVLNMSIYFKSFFKPNAVAGTTDFLHYSIETPALLQWTERERREIDYLLGIVGASPSYSVSPSGTINITVDLDCACNLIAPATMSEGERLVGRKPLAVCLVSNDPSLARLSARGGLANHDLQLLKLEDALDAAHFDSCSVVMIDLADDIALAVTLVEELRKRRNDSLQLIAICPSGVLRDVLVHRLEGIGFTGLVQKPIDYARLLEMLPPSLSNPLQSIQQPNRQ
jgi:HAMP domain-containing protein